MSQSLDEPIFKAVFGSSWEHLPLIFKKHYQNKPFSSETVEARGYLDIQSHRLMNLLKPFYRFLGTVPITNELNVPVLVRYRSLAHSTALCLERTFLFKNHAPYHFFSTMYPREKSEVIDVMRFGLAWRIKYLWQNNNVILAHNGYAVKLFNYFLPVPITFLIGRIDAYEYVVDENHFRMKAEITHWLFGVLYSYAGKFEILT